MSHFIFLFPSKLKKMKCSKTFLENILDLGKIVVLSIVSVEAFILKIRLFKV